MTDVNRTAVHRAHAATTRHEMHEGRDHLVVPVVMIREGVLNGAFVGRDEFGKVAQAWNGRPVTVAHPEQRGQNISASNDPKTHERTVGLLFNARADGDRLKAEAWIDTAKAKSLGHSVTLQTLESGAEGMEVSTGYFADSEQTAGEHNGRPYTHIDRNLVPDHLALLPGDIGACSWGDGCGVRANKSEQGRLAAAWRTIAHTLGFQTNCAGCAGDCQCNGGNMPKEKTVAERVNALKANKAITPEQLEMVQGLDNEQAQMMLGIIESMLKAKPDDEPADDTSPADDAPPATNASKAISVNSDEGRKLIANEVKEGMRRERVLDKLQANAANAFDDETLGSMSIAALETYERSIRPKDYSGNGGFASNGAAYDENAAPLTIHRGVLAPAPKTEQ